MASKVEELENLIWKCLMGQANDKDSLAHVGNVIKAFGEVGGAGDEVVAKTSMIVFLTQMLTSSQKSSVVTNQKVHATSLACRLVEHGGQKTLEALTSSEIFG